MIRVGIIGCGKIAQIRHIPEYESNPDVQLCGFYDINHERAGALADRYGAAAYESVEALLAEPGIDAVSVLTPNRTHASISIAAMEAGKHVLCEKPMATTLEDCVRMADTAKRTGRSLMIAQNQRLTAAHQRARALLREGAIGDVITFRTSFSHSGADQWSIDGRNSWFMDRSQSCFGAMADLGVHKADLMVYLLGTGIARAGAVIGTLHKRQPDGALISVDDNALCTFVMENGVIGTMNASWTNYGCEDNSTSIYGSTGSMHIYRDPEHAIAIERAGRVCETYDEEAIATNEHQTRSGVIDLFVRGLMEGKAPAISAEDVLPAMKAIFACARSAECGGGLIDV